jgi:hypothetical protein
MDIVIHRIRLHPGVSADRFETWIREVDYAGCPQLPSVLSFSVQRAAPATSASWQYFEVIAVSSLQEFEQDMRTSAFGRLAEGFGQLASVVDETTGKRVEPGYISRTAARQVRSR